MLKSLNLFKIIDSFIISGYEYIYDDHSRIIEEKNLGDSTVILIAHRVTTLMQADKIMVLDKGKIVEIGTHDELMAKNGVYRRIYDMQMTLPEEVTGNE